MIKKYGLAILFLSHDVLFCMEQTSRSSQERERQSLIAHQLQKQLEKCAICKRDMAAEENVLKVKPCDHQFHPHCFVVDGLSRDSKYCPSCHITSWLSKEDVVGASSLEQRVIDMMETKGWFKRPDVIRMEHSEQQQGRMHVPAGETAVNIVQASVLPQARQALTVSRCGALALSFFALVVSGAFLGLGAAGGAGFYYWIQWSWGFLVYLWNEFIKKPHEVALYLATIYLAITLVILCVPVAGGVVGGGSLLASGYFLLMAILRQRVPVPFFG